MWVVVLTKAYCWEWECALTWAALWFHTDTTHASAAKCTPNPAQTHSRGLYGVSLGTNEHSAHHNRTEAVTQAECCATYSHCSVGSDISELQQTVLFTTDRRQINYSGVTAVATY